MNRKLETLSFLLLIFCFVLVDWVSCRLIHLKFVFISRPTIQDIATVVKTLGITLFIHFTNVIASIGRLMKKKLKGLGQGHEMNFCLKALKYCVSNYFLYECALMVLKFVAALFFRTKSDVLTCF